MRFSGFMSIPFPVLSLSTILLKSCFFRTTMPFSKTFPKPVLGSNYPYWEEVFLSEEEEKQVEQDCRRENIRILDECLSDAKAIAIKHRLNTEENQVRLAITLFEKRASHEIFWKESKAKEKFDVMFKH